VEVLLEAKAYLATKSKKAIARKLVEKNLLELNPKNLAFLEDLRDRLYPPKFLGNY
jgi:hypothetical protein